MAQPSTTREGVHCGQMELSDEARKAIRDAFADALITLRKQRGLSQERMAQRSRIDRSYASGLERGEHDPSIQTLYKLVMGMEITWVDFATQMQKALYRRRKTLDKAA